MTAVFGDLVIVTLLSQLFSVRHTLFQASPSTLVGENEPILAFAAISGSSAK